jgi:hypothetical protein
MNHDFKIKKFFVHMILNGKVFPEWIHLMFIVLLIDIVLLETMATLTLTYALILINRYIKQQSLSKTNKLNSGVLGMHICFSAFENIALVVVVLSVVNATNPTQDCTELVSTGLRTPRMINAYQCFMFVSQIFVY